MTVTTMILIQQMMRNTRATREHWGRGGALQGNPWELCLLGAQVEFSLQTRVLNRKALRADWLKRLWELIRTPNLGEIIYLAYTTSAANVILFPFQRLAENTPFCVLLKMKTSFSISMRFFSRNTRDHESLILHILSPAGNRRRGRGAPMVNPSMRGRGRYQYNYWAPDNNTILNNARANKARGGARKKQQVY